ncbi:MAG: SufD family Fe-S cluster assembly protein [Candidatus Omnitrophica bacterium]|nr:SufD family Fe-S cluster assembly protein [Candidatus Omnitrophota bacterium]MBU1924705.1 SufD family Fe-S cluster assembly protein [Candidatus Omnitrophota bacterium]
MPKIDHKKLAKAAKEKKAAFGEDVDIKSFGKKKSSHAYIRDLSNIKEAERENLLTSGIDLTGKERSGTYLQMDHNVVHCSVKQEGLELMSVDQARDKYSWFEDYWWKAVKVDADKYTAQAELEPHFGYFIRAQAGVETIFPLQACLYLGMQGTSQHVHNVIIAEEGASLHIITGCTVAKNVKAGLHLGVSEFYVKKNAKITFTMVHNWAEDVSVRPRTGTIVEENGLFLSNYICMKPVKSLQMYPVSNLVGPGATARYNTILVAPPGSNMDVGSKVVLAAPNTKAEVVARTLTTGGNIIARGQLIGEVKSVKAHLECRGLILKESGMIHAIPELIGKVSGVDLSHEAAVGKIAQEEIEYLMSRGISREEATATIVRGFLNVQIEGLPQVLKKEMDGILDTLEKEAF